jgi:HD-GYP domain-containing protein (c-di-GMP phosphodiesterase class II)
MADHATSTSTDAHEILAIASSLNSTLDLDFLLQKIGLAAEKLLDSEASSIMPVDDTKQFLYFRVATGKSGGALKKMTVPIGKGIAGICAQNRLPVVVNDAQSDNRVFKSADQTSGFVTRSLLAVPMIWRGELIGVAEVLNKRSGPYTEEDTSLMMSLGNLASVAITNAKMVQDQKNFFSYVLELLSGAIETAKPRMEGHPAISAKMSCAIGKMFGMKDQDYRALYYAGLLHDIGYIGLKNLRTRLELGFMDAGEENHPAASVKMLEGINILKEALPVIRHHHERWDGTGFPSRLKGEDIPLGARVLALVESVEEIRMLTGMKGEALKQRALSDVKDGSGNRFDPQVVDAFTQLLESGASFWD